MIGTKNPQPATPPRLIRGYTPVPAGALDAMSECPFNLYVADAFGGRPVLYCSSGYKAEQDDLVEAVRQRDRTLYIRNADQEAFSDKLHVALDGYLEREDVPAVERLAVLQSAVTSGLKRTFSLLRVEAAIKESEDVGRRIAKLLHSTTAVPPGLVALAQHDRDTLAHSINVSILAVALGKELGFRREDELAEIAVGAMLHDVGKRHIPARILASTQPLSPEEKRLVRMHPQRGYEELCEQESLSFGQLMMVYQHHERVDGNGYPVGVAGDELHPLGTIM